MKNNSHIYKPIVLLVLVSLISGCATRNGRIVDRPSIVKFNSEKNTLYYYLITVAENRDLGGGYRPLLKDEKVLNVLAKKTAYPADGLRQEFRKGEFVMLLDCQKQLLRMPIYFNEESIEETFSCP